MALISERFRKNIAASFSPGTLKARGASVKASLGRVHGPGPGLSAGKLSGVQLSKEGGRGGCLVLTPFPWQTLSSLLTVFLAMLVPC